MSHSRNIVIFSLVLASTFCISFQRALPSDQKTMDRSKFTEQQLNEWKDYKVKFGKKYDQDEEDLKHMQNYFETLKTIEEHNKKYKAGTVSWEMGINQFTDLSQEEFKKNCCGLVLPDKLKTGTS